MYSIEKFTRSLGSSSKELLKVHANGLDANLASKKLFCLFVLLLGKQSYLGEWGSHKIALNFTALTVLFFNLFCALIKLSPSLFFVHVTWLLRKS